MDRPRFYRYHGSGMDTSIGLSIYLELEVYVGFKETECGWWVIPLHSQYLLNGDDVWRQTKYCRRWVSKNARKRFCYPTRELAWDSFKARCRHRRVHARRAMEVADKLIAYVNEEPNPPQEGYQWTINPDSNSSKLLFR